MLPLLVFVRMSSYCPLPSINGSVWLWVNKRINQNGLSTREFRNGLLGSSIEPFELHRCRMKAKKQTELKWNEKKKKKPSKPTQRQKTSACKRPTICSSSLNYKNENLCPKWTMFDGRNTSSASRIASTRYEWITSSSFCSILGIFSYFISEFVRCGQSRPRYQFIAKRTFFSPPLLLLLPLFDVRFENGIDKE